ncbi:hypothetical protein, partial [Paraburkholderia sp. SIMBA_054]|uniref:hypothetical protein n=1 Tax=Paraburkholderia sp. SIMBA_054 TaxID=3085795 RepID=UPI003979F15F
VHGVHKTYLGVQFVKGLDNFLLIEGYLEKLRGSEAGVNDIWIGDNFHIAPQVYVPPRAAAAYLWTLLGEHGSSDARLPRADAIDAKPDSQGLVDLHLPVIGVSEKPDHSVERLLDLETARETLVSAGVGAKRLSLLPYHRLFSSRWPWPFGEDV